MEEVDKIIIHSLRTIGWARARQRYEANKAEKKRQTRSSSVMPNEERKMPKDMTPDEYRAYRTEQRRKQRMNLIHQKKAAIRIKTVMNEAFVENIPSPEEATPSTNSKRCPKVGDFVKLTCLVNKIQKIFYAGVIAVTSETQFSVHFLQKSGSVYVPPSREDEGLITPGPPDFYSWEVLEDSQWQMDHRQSDIEDDIQSLKQFSTEIIVATVVRCLKVISGDVDLPSSLPPGMSARFRVGASLANHVQDLGYKGGDLGYQTFLYSNESEIRKIFMFLVEKLPKESSSQAADEPMGSSILLHRAISNEIKNQLKSPWLPPFLKNKSIRNRSQPPGWQREGASCLQYYRSCYISSPQSVGNIAVKIPKEMRSYYNTAMPYITNQTHLHRDTAPSVMETNALEVSTHQEWESEWNQVGLGSRLSPEEFKARKKSRLMKMLRDRLQQDSQHRDQTDGQTFAGDLQQLITSIESQSRAGQAKTKGSRFTHAEKLQYATDDATTAQMVGSTISTQDTEEELEQKRQAETEGLRSDLSSLTSELEKLDLDIKKFTASKQQMEEVISTETKSAEEKKNAYCVKKRTLDLLPEAESNIAKLQTVVDSSAQKLVTLSKQWETHRAPLIEQYRQLRLLNSQRESEAEKKLEEIKLFRVRMKETADDARRKEELQKQLVSEYGRMTKDVNRSAYTRKILEIVANIKKQKQEIDKILVDTKNVQKEINSVSGKLDRTFTVTDELIFRDAKKDESVKKAYRFLAALHENCEQLIKTVEDTGTVMREIKDLEEQIETESNKKVLSNLEKISSDLQQMKKENATLLAKVKGK